MKLAVVKQAVTSSVGRKILLTKKNSPAVMFTVGVVGSVASTVLACRATMQLEDILEKAEKKRIEVEEWATNPANAGKMSAKDLELARRGYKIWLARDIAKAYAPAVIVGAVSIGCLTGAHVTLTKRNAAITAAYAALQKGFNEYRERVKQVVGEDEEQRIRMRGWQHEHKSEEKDEDGKKKTVRHTWSTLDGDRSIYARLWAHNTTNSWNPQPEYCLAFLKSQQHMANDRLKSRGHLFLNEVYDDLGLERTKEGAIVGWVMDGGNSDNYVDFGIFKDRDGQTFMEFITGHEGGIWLDFNVDGVVYDLI